MRVICENTGTCTRDPQCGAMIPHNDGHCEPCPFVPTAKCVEVKTVLCFGGEEHEMPCCSTPSKDHCDQCQEVGLANPLNQG